MFLKFAVSKSNKKGLPVAWRVDIVKCMALAQVDVLGKSSPCVDIFWRGPARRDGEMEVFDSWLNVGRTHTKERTIDPAFTKEDGANLEFPPCWTDYDVPDRGPLGVPLTGGCWCPKNQLPEEDPASKDIKGSALDQINRRITENHAEAVAKAGAAASKGSSAMLANLRSTIASTITDAAAAEEERRKKMDPFNHVGVHEHIQFKLAVHKLLFEAEDRERGCMAREELRCRRSAYEQEQIRTKPYKLINYKYGRQYSRMKQYIQEVPPILDRLIYEMGKDLDGGGMRFRCADPATGDKLEVVMVPILFPEDELELHEQMQTLIGRYHTNLVKVLDYSAHQLRHFNMTGYTAIDERVAIIITNRPEGPNLRDYIKDNFSNMDNMELREYLIQIFGGLNFLHRDGLLHRNVHPGCVVMDLPVAAPTLDDDGEMDGAARMKMGKFRDSKIRPRIGDYWFMHNPRAPGCEYSQGRADWGFAQTAPPEVLGGHKISDKSDVYAMGTCVYYWVTGEYPNLETTSLEDLRRVIPLKWGMWVHSLLRMCMQRHPKYRASAEQVFLYLSTLKEEKINIPFPPPDPETVGSRKQQTRAQRHTMHENSISSFIADTKKRERKTLFELRDEIAASKREPRAYISESLEEEGEGSVDDGAKN
jgi:serine/threonine protein kinase